jgi:sporulation protein YlmC with PRC-barrel domain
MQIKEFLGSTVLDKNAYEIGKVSNVDFDTATGKIENITLTLQKNIFSKDEVEISFEDIATIGAYVILNKEIPKEAEKAEEDAEEEAKTVEVEIEDDE